jgi:hypothetical protein
VATVRGSIAVIPGRVWHKTPKSQKPRRVELPDLAMKALRCQRKIQATDKLRAGGHYQDDGFVFAPEIGGHYSPNSLIKSTPGGQSKPVSS